jgi:hypothetical protein
MRQLKGSSQKEKKENKKKKGNSHRFVAPANGSLHFSSCHRLTVFDWRLLSYRSLPVLLVFSLLE